MKKTHLILLLAAAITALLSAYSLVMLNKVYKIDFEWYSKYYNKFTDSYREAFGSSWSSKDIMKYLDLKIIASNNDGQMKPSDFGLYRAAQSNLDLNRYIVIYLELKEAFSPEYNLKVTNIAQRGNVVEIRVAITAPQEKADFDKTFFKSSPYDIVRIDKNSIPIKGNLVFLFKDQNGQQFYKETAYVR